MQKEAEKKLKYNSLCIEMQWMWNLKCTIVPVIIGATGMVTGSLRKNLEAVPGKHSIDSLQKTAILGTSHTIQKVLQCEAWSVSGGDHCWFKWSNRKKCLWQETSISYNNNNNNNRVNLNYYFYLLLSFLRFLHLSIRFSVRLFFCLSVCLRVYKAGVMSVRLQSWVYFCKNWM